MPIVRVRKSNTLGNFDNLAIILKKVVAENLNVPGNPDGLLGLSDVEVYFDRFQICDRHSRDLEIIIEANLLPERLENLQDRTKLIVKELRKWIFQKYTFFVWVRLCPGAYVEG